MIALLAGSLGSEWLKLRRSLTGWLVLGAGLFVPLILFAVRLRMRRALPAQYASGTFWDLHWTQSWEALSVLILPLAVMLVTTLIVQLEFRNNCWKQLHVSPQPLALVFFTKLAMILGAVGLLFGVINLGFLASGWLPALVVEGAEPWRSPLPATRLLLREGRFFAECLPIIGLQYPLSLRFKNFLVPLGIGLGIWVFSLVLFNSGFASFAAFEYAGLDFAIVTGHREATTLLASPLTLSLSSFAPLLAAGLLSYTRRTDRG